MGLDMRSREAHWESLESLMLADQPLCTVSDQLAGHQQGPATMQLAATRARARQLTLFGKKPRGKRSPAPPSSEPPDCTHHL